MCRSSFFSAHYLLAVYIVLLVDFKYMLDAFLDDV